MWTIRVVTVKVIEALGHGDVGRIERQDLVQKSGATSIDGKPSAI